MTKLSSSCHVPVIFPAYITSQEPSLGLSLEQLIDELSEAKD